MLIAAATTTAAPPTKKPISPKQLAANRANAKKSTGPRTPAARNKIRLNALTHGLSAPLAAIAEEDQAGHREFCTPLIAALAPASADELELALTIATGYWRIDRVRALENNMFALGFATAGQIDAPDAATQWALSQARTFFDNAAKFNLLSTYEQRIHRLIQQNSDRLINKQTERRSAAHYLHQKMALSGQTEPACPNAINQIPPDSDQNGIVYEKHAFTAPAAAVAANQPTEASQKCKPVSIPDPLPRFFDNIESSQIPDTTL